MKIVIGEQLPLFPDLTVARLYRLNCGHNYETEFKLDKGDQVRCPECNQTHSGRCIA